MGGGVRGVQMVLRNTGVEGLLMGAEIIVHLKDKPGCWGPGLLILGCDKRDRKAPCRVKQDRDCLFSKALLQTQGPKAHPRGMERADAPFLHNIGMGIFSSGKNTMQNQITIPHSTKKRQIKGKGTKQGEKEGEMLNIKTKNNPK